MLIFSDLLVKDVGMFGKLHQAVGKTACCLFDEPHLSLIYFLG